MTAKLAAAGLAAALAIVAGASASADLLVTRDGQVIETRGGWEVRGRLLVFELPDGTLASLRLEEADLEASDERARQAAERARQARRVAPRAPSAPAAATVVITDRDVLPAPPLIEEPGSEGETGPAGGGLEAAAATGGKVAGDGGVQVVEWSPEPEGETGLAVRGVIQNLGSSFASGLSLNALFYDDSGLLVAARDVALERAPLEPGARREFALSIPDSLVYAEIKFLVVGRGFRPVGQTVRVDGAPPALP